MQTKLLEGRATPAFLGNTLPVNIRIPTATSAFETTKQAWDSSERAASANPGVRFSPSGMLENKNDSRYSSFGTCVTYKNQNEDQVSLTDKNFISKRAYPRSRLAESGAQYEMFPFWSEASTLSHFLNVRNIHEIRKSILDANKANKLSRGISR